MIVALHAAYAAFNRGDIDAAVEPLDAQIEWSEPAEFPGGGTYQGREGVKQYLAQSRAPWTLARIAGHSSIAMSTRYVHPSEDAVFAAVDRLGGHKIGHSAEQPELQQDAPKLLSR